MKTINTKTSDSQIIRTENVERYLKEIKNQEKFTAVEERELIKNAQLGCITDRNRLARAHLRFVVSCAKEYQCKGVEIADLIGVGNEGLILAIEKFDLTKDVRFITCAVWWVKYKLIEYVKQTFSLIQIPLNQQAELKKIALAKEAFDKKNETDSAFSQILELKDFNYVRPSVICSREFESLDTPINDGVMNGGTEECTLYQILPSESQTDFSLERSDRIRIIKNYLEILSPVQKEVITLYYGLNDQVEKTDQDVARLLSARNLTPERIRQIRLKSIEKLKNGAILKNFY